MESRTYLSHNTEQSLRTNFLVEPTKTANSRKPSQSDLRIESMAMESPIKIGDELYQKPHTNSWDGVIEILGRFDVKGGNEENEEEQERRRIQL